MDTNPQATQYQAYNSGRIQVIILSSSNGYYLKRLYKHQLF